MMVLLTKIVTNINLKTSTSFEKRLTLVAWLGPGCVFADAYITVLKIQTEVCEDEREEKIGSF